jgi:hypothetical protein
MSSLSKRETSNIRQVLADRLILSEAIEAVNRMIRGYANRGQADKSYIGAMAELLLHYPKSVALACADPFHGVVRATKFMPTPSDIIAFCENRIEPMHREADREERVAKQLDERDAWMDQVIPESLKAKGRAWLDRTDPKAQQLIGQEARADETLAGLERIQEANRSVFERECKRDGIDPAGGVSPTLRKLLGVGNVTSRKSGADGEARRADTTRDAMDT